MHVLQALRRRVVSRGRKVTVYTGTHGVCTLADAFGVEHELYLHADENNNRIIPVPLYFYKVGILKEINYLPVNSEYCIVNCL